MGSGASTDAVLESLPDELSRDQCLAITKEHFVEQHFEELANSEGLVKKSALAAQIKASGTTEQGKRDRLTQQLRIFRLQLEMNIAGKFAQPREHLAKGNRVLSASSLAMHS